MLVEFTSTKPKKIKTKNIKRIKWLLKETIPLTVFYSPREIDCLPQSTIVRSERAIEEITGVAEFRGGVIITREVGKGLFFSSDIMGQS